MRNALVASLALTLAACGGPLLFAEVEDRNVCIQMKSATIPAAPPLDLPSQTVRWEGDFDLASHIAGLDQKGATGEIKMLSLTVAGVEGALQDIDAAEVDITEAGGTALEPFMHYAKSAESLACDASTGTCTMKMTIDRDLDLFARLQGGQLHYAISFTGRPPTVDWTASIETCMSVKVMIDALEAMKGN